MLTQLLIRNLAIIDEAVIDAGAGLTVLTGETGAGKSIMVDALGLALGERADSDAVRRGAQRAEVTASFAPGEGSAAADWLRSHDLDATEGDELSCVLRRVVNSDGRSRGYINGTAVPVQSLRELGDLLVDVCGQQSHQSLTRPDRQRALLDEAADNGELLETLGLAWQHWLGLKQESEALERSEADREARLELLRFQAGELERLAVQPGEAEELVAAQRRAANAARLQSGVTAALAAIYEGDGEDQATAHDLTSRAIDLLTDLTGLEPELDNAARLLQESRILLSEAAESLRHYLRHESTDGANLQELETRLAALHDCARKHRCRVEELPELTLRLCAERDRLENADATRASLAQQLQAAHQRLLQHCQKLGRRRRKTATQLASLVTSKLRELGMPDAVFSIELQPLAEPGPNGQDRVEFRITVNPGMPAGPLARVASGGELSRVSLAIQVATNSRTQTPTLIFDEVDAGIGGGTADIVGQQLQQLAGHSQVLCITHLPQVAAKGHWHLQVRKLTDGSTTRTEITALDQAQRVEELARMLGGMKITGRTRAHAEEMLQAAATHRSH